MPIGRSLRGFFSHEMFLERYEALSFSATSKLEKKASIHIGLSRSDLGRNERYKPMLLGNAEI